MLVAWHFLQRHNYKSLFTQDITVDNYDEAVTAVSGAVRGAATSEQEQTTDVHCPPSLHMYRLGRS